MRREVHFLCIDVYVVACADDAGYIKIVMMIMQGSFQVHLTFKLPYCYFEAPVYCGNLGILIDQREGF